MTSARTLWWRTLAMGGVAGAFAVGTWYGTRMTEARQPWAREQLLSTALDSVRVNFLDSLPERELLKRAVSGMLRELHDPYAALLETDGKASYQGTLRGESQGLGLLLRLRGSAVMVRRVAPGSPAELAGVRAGDVVLAVDGRPAAEAWNTPRPDAGVRDSAGQASDTVQLRIARAVAGDSASVSIVRSSWRVAAVSDAMLAAEGVGYARLASSASGSAEELERAVEALVDRGARSLVLDLRGNRGGLFEEGVKAASLFLSRGDLVATLERRGAASNHVETVRRSRWPSLPLVVLVDASTASSAELIAAALRDHRRALLVGERTYGKGVVQRVVNINTELSLRLSTARWLPPSGEAIERRQERGGAIVGGLVPDVLVSPAARLDPAAVPASLSPLLARAISDAADRAIDAALAEGWSSAPVVTLERRLRDLLEPVVADITVDPALRTTLLGDGVRVAVRRLLEMTRGDDVLWSYAAYDDAALRAGLDVVAPGLSTAALPDSGSPARIATGADSAPLAGDSATVARLGAWVTARFRASESEPADDELIAGTTRPAPRIDGPFRTMTRDTVVAVHFATSPFSPAHRVQSVVRLADASGTGTPLEGTVVARYAFRAPVTPLSGFVQADAWRHGWAYLVVLPSQTAAAHAGGFTGWRVIAAR